VATDSNVAITAGSGTPVDTVLLSGGDHQQVVREVRASAGFLDEWTIATSASTRLSADVARVGMHMYNDSTSATVYVTVHGTNPTITSYAFALPMQGYFDFPLWMGRLEIRVIGSVASGILHTTYGTCA
jgi:hypothetical protein